MVSVIFRNGTGKASTQLYTAWKNTMMIIFKLWDGGSAHFFHGRKHWHHEHYVYIVLFSFNHLTVFIPCIPCIACIAIIDSLFG